jgi:hypothetical protein
MCCKLGFEGAVDVVPPAPGVAEELHPSRDPASSRPALVEKLRQKLKFDADPLFIVRYRMRMSNAMLLCDE